VVVHQCPDPERLLALAGTVRDVEHNWEVDRYGPRGVAKARMRDRARVDAELVRAAQPGEAWVIQAGHAVHLRVLPPPAVAPEAVAPAAVLPLGERDTEPLTVVQEPASGRIAAAVARTTRTVRRAAKRARKRRQRPGRLPQPDGDWAGGQWPSGGGGEYLRGGPGPGRTRAAPAARRYQHRERGGEDRPARCAAGWDPAPSRPGRSIDRTGVAQPWWPPSSVVAIRPQVLRGKVPPAAAVRFIPRTTCSRIPPLA
jgi:hypothetical protein